MLLIEGEENEDEEDTPNDGTGGLPQSGQSGTREAQLARRITKGKKNRRVLSNKPQDFQVVEFLQYCFLLYLCHSITALMLCQCSK